MYYPSMSTRAGRIWLCVIVLAIGLVGCTENGSVGRGTGDVISVTLIQMNDVYEITPVAGGKEGGLARVATLRKQLLSQNANTVTILAGDLLSPSALGTATVDGQPLAGRQMVDVMNSVGLDYATFGNHEFDLKQDTLAQRIAESKFKWFSSNVDGLTGVPRNVIFTEKNSEGKSMRIGLFGLTIGSNNATYVSYEDPISVAKEQVAALRDKVDVVIAVTHLNLDGDIQLVQSVPGIDFVLGGHEHENTQVERGTSFTPVFKADANARSVYIHQLRFNTATKKLETESKLQRITSQFADDPHVADVVAKWMKAAFAGFRALGFDPERVAATTNEVLDGRESSVRTMPTTLTKLVAKGMLDAAPGTELAIFNAGSIRIDDEIPAGEVTEYDVLRTLPFNGSVESVDMSGSLLQRVLDQGIKNAGTGGYLQTANVTRSPANDGWLIGGLPLVATRTYSVAIDDFLLTGGETGLDFLKAGPDIKNQVSHGDIRKAMIAELQR